MDQDTVKGLFLYCDKGFLIWKKKTHASANNTPLNMKAGTKDFNGYMNIGINNKIYKEHRLVYLYHFGFIPKIIDHINRNKEDNRIENLRECTHSQNKMNQGLKSNNTSGVVGVNFDLRRNNWYARITIKGNVKYLGSYKDIEEAKKVRFNAERKYFKEFAYISYC